MDDLLQEYGRLEHADKIELTAKQLKALMILRAQMRSTANRFQEIKHRENILTCIRHQAEVDGFELAISFLLKYANSNHIPNLWPDDLLSEETLDKLRRKEIDPELVKKIEKDLDEL